VFLVYLSLNPEHKNKIEKLQNFYTEFYLKNVVKEPLLSGKEIMRILNIPPSKIVGTIKEALLEKQLEGKIKTKEEAIDFIKLHYNTST